MMYRPRGLWTMAAAFVTTAVAAPAAAQEDAIEWRQEMRRGEILEIRNITGDVRVTLASGSTAEVYAEKRGRASDFDRLDIVIEQERDGYTICALYGEPGRDSCDGRGDDRDDHDDRNLRASVHFEVRLPAGVELVGTTVTGDVTVRDVESDVTAKTVTGDVEISTTGVAEASTVSGSIDVEMASGDWDDLSFNTVSGDITLRLPADVGADVEFESLSGDFDTDFDLRSERTRNRFIGSHVEGTIGSGGRSLSLHTVSGDARLLRGRRAMMR